MADFRAIANAVKEGRAKSVKQLVNDAVAEGASAEAILNEGLVVGMSELGEMFKNNEVYVPEVLIAARAMKVQEQMMEFLSERTAVPASLALGRRLISPRMLLARSVSPLLMVRQISCSTA